ncbi:AMP-binding protein [uncultured Desulfovibrio sp.]|uniref:AMP-binding protein n=1 Tax=uncultured Desulfovibrio sp. TaxID=167968 RepID=UPI0003A6F422|nr:AMP-binding protein [uncultured Desulfovibrio sp.]
MYHYNLGTFCDEVAARWGQKTALRYADGQYTYDRLTDISRCLALLLMKEGCGRGDVIAIAHNKHPLSYALMLAALRLGVPYVIVDAASPIARTAKIMATAQPHLLFYDDVCYEEPMRRLAGESGVPCLFLDEAVLPESRAACLEELHSRTKDVDGSTLAYIMFTSGSTGVPKGVAVTHQNILHFIQWGTRCFEVSEEDIFANLSPMYFDNSVFDFYIALFSGASLAPVPRELLAKPYDLVAHVGRMACTVWFSVPSLLIYVMAMKAMQPRFLPALRSISFGGEGYPKAELKKLYDLFAPQAHIVNVYGPTECTCICSAYQLDDADFADLEGLPPLGRLNQNFDYFIEGADGDRGTEGELVLAGPNVSAGYFNDPERTATAFLTLNEPRRFMKRAYRTGDLVCEVDGKLYFQGRKDNQIKHMGYRIELEEIESGLMRLPGVSQAAVVYHRQTAAYGKIFAFVAYEGHEDDKTLLRRLSEVLPSYMIPSRLNLMDSLPKNANGKVDRQALKNLAVH